MHNLEMLKQIQEVTLKKINLIDTKETHRILIGMGTCGKAAGAKQVFDYLSEMKREYDYPIQICPTGCLGMCVLEPMVEIIDRNGQHTIYIQMDEQKMKEVLHQHIKQNNIVEQYTMNGMRQDNES
jgi:NADP-reducing hydrogenase subunit HndB